MLDNSTYLGGLLYKLTNPVKELGAQYILAITLATVYVPTPSTDDSS